MAGPAKALYPVPLARVSWLFCRKNTSGVWKLAANTIGIDEVADAISSNNANLPTGVIWGPNRTFTVLANGRRDETAGYSEKTDRPRITRIDANEQTAKAGLMAFSIRVHSRYSRAIPRLRSPAPQTRL